MNDNPAAINFLIPNQEALPPNPNLFYSRVRIQRDPIINFSSYYLTAPDLKSEAAVDFERASPISLRIERSNIDISTAHFLENESLLGTPAESAYKLMSKMPQPNLFYFSLVADVRDGNMPLPKNGKSVAQDSFVPHEMRVTLDEKQGLVVNCDTLTPEQINFSLDLMIKSLDFTLSQAGKGRIQPGQDYKGKNQDQIIFDNYFLTATDADLQRDLASQADREKYAKLRDVKIDQLRDFRRNLRDILRKRTQPLPRTIEEATQYFSKIEYFDDERDIEPLHRKFLLVSPPDSDGLRTLIPIHDPETKDRLRSDVQIKVKFKHAETEESKTIWSAIVGSINGSGRINTHAGYNIIQMGGQSI